MFHTNINLDTSIVMEYQDYSIQNHVLKHLMRTYIATCSQEGWDDKEIKIFGYGDCEYIAKMLGIQSVLIVVSFILEMNISGHSLLIDGLSVGLDQVTMSDFQPD